MQNAIVKIMWTIKSNKKSNWKMPPCNISENNWRAICLRFFISSSKYCSTPIKCNSKYPSWHETKKLDFFFCLFANCHSQIDIELGLFEDYKKSVAITQLDFFPRKSISTSKDFKIFKEFFSLFSDISSQD